MYGQGNKYGAEPGDALSLLLAARRLGLDVAGVCFHVGSGATQPAGAPRRRRASQATHGARGRKEARPACLGLCCLQRDQPAGAARLPREPGNPWRPGC